MKMRSLITGALLLSLFHVTLAHGCAGCALSKQKNLTANIQADSGRTASNAARGSGGRVTAQEAQAAFKDSKVFDSVGRDQGEVDSNWSSAIGDK